MAKPLKDSLSPEGFRALHPENQVPVPMDVQRLMVKVTQQQGDWPTCHGETGTTYGGAGFSPLVRSIHFLSYLPKNERLIHRGNGTGSHRRDVKTAERRYQ